MANRATLKIRAIAGTLVVLAATACGEVDRNPDECNAEWCLIATGKQQRLYHAAVWTGDELLVWGGLDGNDGDALATGLRIQPHTGRVRPISVEGSPSARWSPYAVWTGQEMLVWGGQSYTSKGANRLSDAAVGGSAYDPKTDAWRPIADPRPVETVAEAVAWTGKDLFVWGGRVGSDGPRRDGFLFNPASNATQPVSDAIPEAGAVNADTVSVDGVVVINGGFTNFPEAHPVRYDVLADSWQAVAPPPPGLGADGGAPTFGYDGTAYFCSRDLLICGAYSIADDTWDEVDLSEAIPPFEDWPAWAVTDQALVLFGSPDLARTQRIAVSYDFAKRSWQDLPASGAPPARRGQSATWIGNGVLFWGGSGKAGPAVTEQGWLLRSE